MLYVGEVEAGPGTHCLLLFYIIYKSWHVMKYYNIIIDGCDDSVDDVALSIV